MPRSRDKAKKPKQKKSARGKRQGSGNISQTVKISLGGAGGALEGLYKQLQGKMGGLGSQSSASYPSSPSYYRLAPPSQQFAITPNALSGANMAIPNNLVSQTLSKPMEGNTGLAERLGTMVQDTKQRVLAKIAKPLSSRLLPTDPEPNRPISAVQSQMVAGRPITQDPSLPRQRPAGRDNYMMPYDAQQGAPDSGFFPQQAQAPISIAQEQALQRQVASSSSTPSGGTKKKSPPRKK